jgi:ectoine hydroxylase
MQYPHLTAADKARFWDDGILVKRRYFDDEEIGFVRRALVEDATLRDSIIDRRQAFGADDDQWRSNDQIVQIMWNQSGDDLFGAISRGTRLVDGAELLLGGEVYNYSHCLNMKPPGAGGSFRWHQDFGYWYENGNLFPYMLNAIIAVDPTRRDNGCIQVLRGSHRLGRVTHLTDRGQSFADPERVEWAKSRLETVFVELDPGDVMFQHCNILHCSEPNTSDGPRTIMLFGYNLARNDPFRAHHLNSYSPLEKLPDTAVKARGHILNGAERDYLRAKALEN